MLASSIGGALVAFAFLVIMVLKRAGQRQPKPFWSRSESIESFVAVGLVCMISLGFAMIVSTIGSGGWVALLVGSAIAVVGSTLAIVFGGGDGKAAAASSTQAKTA